MNIIDLNISPKKNYDLFKKNNLKSFIWFSTHLILILLSYIFAILSSNILLFLVALIFLGLFSSFTGLTGAAHEFYHNTVFTNKSVNKAIYRILLFFNLINYDYNSVSHKIHHSYNSDDEKDSEKTIEKITFLDLFFLFTINLPSLFSRIKNLILNSLNIFPKSAVNSYIDDNLRFKIKKTARTILIIHISIFVFVSSFLNFYYYFLLFIAPFTFNFLSNMIGRAQHYQLAHNSNDTFQNTRTIRMNFLLEFLNWNMNYHIEHHINPAIPFYNLPKFHKKIRERIGNDIIHIKSFDRDGIVNFIILILRDNFILKKFV
jgi:fatty acid desaturase